MIATPKRRRLARNAARAAAVFAATMLALSLFTVVTAGRSPAGAATNNGAATIVDPAARTSRSTAVGAPPSSP